MIARARARVRRSARLVALVRGFRGFVHGVPPATPPFPASTRRAVRVDGVRELLRVTPRRSDRHDHRFNLVVPSVAGASTFGGIQTAIDLFEAVAGQAERLRIISVQPVGEADAAAFPDYRLVAASDDFGARRELVSIAPPNGATLLVGRNDVFIATYWTTAALVLDIRCWQASTFGRAPDRFAYLVQDYEPGFYPWSAPYLLARATYDSPASTIAIFNTTLLQEYFHGAGIQFPSEFSFEPRLSPALRRILARPQVARSRRIVVYGRPGKPRNLFPLIVDGLRAWRASISDADRWTVVSVGQLHQDVDLGGGGLMRSLGKLDLAAYGDLLRESAIGISLMASPHPSYPPLEMAQLGLLVLTNRFGEKDLSSWHTNIASLATVSAASFGEDLVELCQRFEGDLTLGDRGRLLRPEYVDDGPQFPFASEVAALLRRA